MHSQQQKPSATKKAGTMSSNPNDDSQQKGHKKHDDVMLFAGERTKRSATPLSQLAITLGGIDQGTLIAVTVDMIEPGEGTRATDPKVYITERELAGTQAEKEFDAVYAHPANQRGQRFDVLSALWIDDTKVVITGTRELAGFAGDRNFPEAQRQMTLLAEAFRGVQNVRKNKSSDRLRLAGGDIDPMHPNRGDIVSVLISFEDGTVQVLDGPNGGLVAIDIDPTRKVFYALRYGVGDDGVCKELVEASLSELQTMPELLTYPTDPADWRVIATAPRERAFYYASRSNRVGDDTYRSIAITFVGGYTATITLDGAAKTFKASDLTYVGPITYIGRFHTLRGSGMGAVFIDRTHGPHTSPNIRFRGGKESVPQPFHQLVGYDQGASASA